ncbi:hypothetical protein [Marinobacter sp.]|uniref:hypothetical protein n=1 Tax=Marinobacter sp. TaxID=50741 RepID=UPI0026384D7E|nr:hypothetical protein [Marinobacter sp.]
MAEMDNSQHLSDSEREEIWEEGHRAFNMGEEEHHNPHWNGTLEHEIWSDGWEDGFEDERQAVQKRSR